MLPLFRTVLSVQEGHLFRFQFCSFSTKTKNVEAEKNVFWGKASNHLRMGLVGLPNVGKSSTFNLLTNLQVPAHNYPFCTIDPTVATTQVPDSRFDWLVDHFQPQKSIGALLSVTDIAGLVKGASEGAGLGNQFLANIRDCDGIFHIVRSFRDDTVQHTETRVDPVRDLEIISQELLAKDLEILNKTKEQLSRSRSSFGQSPEKKLELEVCEKVLSHLERGEDIRDLKWQNPEIQTINKWRLMVVKPRIFLVNMSKEEFLDTNVRDSILVPIEAWLKLKGASFDSVIPYSVSFEEEIQLGFVEEGEELNSQISQIIKEGYRTLSLIHYFTCGEEEVRCWTIRQGTTAPKAAGVIHSDFEKGFIKAEVMPFESYQQVGSEAKMRATGKIRSEGKSYEVQDGDILFFKGKY